MFKNRYPFRSDWPFYLFLVSYGYLIFNMTYSFYFGNGVNIFASFSDAANLNPVILDANKVYLVQDLLPVRHAFACGAERRLSGGLGDWCALSGRVADHDVRSF